MAALPLGSASVPWRNPGPGPAPHERRDAQLVAMLEDAGLVEVYLKGEGQETYRLTEDGVRVGKMLAWVEGDDADEVLEALLAEAGD